jgi:hypothetical protein
VFLADDDKEYLEVGVTSEGWYYIALNKQEPTPPSKADVTYDRLVDLLEVGSVTTSSDCTTITGDDCWRVEVTFPDSYLPPKKVTKYNVYYTGEGAGKTQAVKTLEDGASSFHDLTTFKTLTGGPVAPADTSLWEAAKDSKQNFKMK